jgi:hypothetical protein
MPVELASWPGAEVLSEIFHAVKGWTIDSSDPAVPGEFASRAEKRIGELLCVAGRITNDLRESLETIRGVLVRPELAHSPAAVLAYTQVEAWAEENELPVTRFCFAALAGLGAPGDLRRPYRVGVLARELARWNAALVWLEHAAAAAGRLGAWNEHIVAVLAFGNTLYRQGLYQQARRVFEKALDLALHHSLRELQGGALHDLVMIAIEMRDTPAAERYARLALAAYGPGHAKVPALAHDLAYLWLGEGHPARALSVFQAVLPHLDCRPSDRIRVLSSLAHAAAAAGDAGRFDVVCNEVLECSLDPAASPAVASALLELARGAAVLGQWGRVEDLANAALRAGTVRGEVDVIARADALLGANATGTGTSEAMARGGTAVGIAKTVAPERGASEVLAEHFIRSIVINDVLRLAGEVHLHRPAADLRRHEVQPLTPSRAAQGTHTVIRRCAWSSRILEYATYRPASSTPGPIAWERVLHAELEGSPSFNRTTRRDVAPPHVHDPTVPGGVREARPEEIPRSPW